MTMTQAKIIQDLADKELCIIVGRCGNGIFGDNARALNICICAL